MNVCMCVDVCVVFVCVKVYVRMRIFILNFILPAIILFGMTLPH